GVIAEQALVHAGGQVELGEGLLGELHRAIPSRLGYNWGTRRVRPRARLCGYRLMLSMESQAPYGPLLSPAAKPKQILKLMLIGQAMARPFAAPPGIPADRKAALISAFERTTKDPDFLAEAEKLNFEVNPVGADKLDALLAEAYAMPKDVIAKAAKAMSD